MMRNILEKLTGQQLAEVKRQLDIRELMCS